MIAILGFVLVTAVLYLAKEILIPIALSILISFLLSPLVLWLEKKGIKRAFGVVLVVLLLMGAVGGLGYLLAGQFVEFVNNLPNYRKNIVTKIHAVKPGRENVFKRAEAMIQDISREVETETTGTATGETSGTATQRTTHTISTTKDSTSPTPSHNAQGNNQPRDPREQTIRAVSGEQQLEPSKKEQALQTLTQGQSPSATPNTAAVPVRVVEVPQNSLQSFQDIVGPVFTILGNVGLVILFVIFFLMQREDLRDRIIRLSGANKVRVTTEALEEAANRVSRYLLMQLIVNVTYGIPVAIGLFFIGVPNAMLWGAMATILRFIPYAGPWIAALMPISLSMAVFDSWTQPILTVGLFVALELVSNNIMEPILYGHSTGVSPVAIIIAAVFWTWLWGAVGLVLATPITVCLVVLGRHIPQLAYLNVLLGDEPVLTDDARIYNRLLSGATDEAVDIAEEYAEEHSLPELYDNVLLPALQAAETDRTEETLSRDRYEKFITGMRELLDEATDKYLIDEDEAPVAHPETEEKGEHPPEGEPEEEVPGVIHRKVLCVPVNDQTDECAAQMLKYLLAKRKDDVEVTKSGMLVSEIMDEIRSRESQIVILSSVPPLAVSHTRYLAKRISAEFPDLKLYAGLWTTPEPEQETSTTTTGVLGRQRTDTKTDSRLKDAGIAQVFTSIADAGLRI